MLPRYILYQSRSGSNGFSPTMRDASPSKHSIPGSLHDGASTAAFATGAEGSMSEYPVMPASVDTRTRPIYVGPVGSSAPFGLLYKPGDFRTMTSTLVIFISSEHPRR